MDAIIVSHYDFPGSKEALKDYLLAKGFNLIYLIHPLNTKNKYSILQKYTNGKLVSERKFKNFGPQLFRYLQHFLLNLLLLVVEKGDYYFGFDNLNAFSGWFLKKIGRIKKVIFYTIDYVPNRFDNKLLNWIYHKLDKFCVYNTDQVWNLSSRMEEARRELYGIKTSNQKVVPIGVYYTTDRKSASNSYELSHLVFMGSLIEKQGVQLLITAMPDIITKHKGTKLIIIGKGEYEPKLKEMVSQLKIENNVIFKGPIYNRSELISELSKCGLALAPYNKKLDWFTYYADPTKLKDYAVAGLPIVTTDVPWNARELERKGFAKIIDYNKEELIQNVNYYLENPDVCKKQRKNALNFAKEHDWKLIFDKVLKTQQN